MPKDGKTNIELIGSYDDDSGPAQIGIEIVRERGGYPGIFRPLYSFANPAKAHRVAKKPPIAKPSKPVKNAAAPTVAPAGPR